MADSDRPWNRDDEHRQQGPSGDARSDPGDGGWRPNAVHVVGAGVAAVVLVAGVGVVVPLVFTTSSCACQPGTTVDFSYDAGNDTVRGVHAGGETFDANDTERLEIVVDGETTGTVELPFGPGDAFDVPALDGDEELRVVWVGPDEDERSIVSTFEVPRE